MDELKVVAPAFVEMAHHIVWCSAATIDQSGRPRSRVLHPVWDWDGTTLRGVIATSPLSPKRADLDAHPFISLNYWANSHDTCLAECSAELEARRCEPRRGMGPNQERAGARRLRPEHHPRLGLADRARVRHPRGRALAAAGDAGVVHGGARGRAAHVVELRKPQNGPVSPTSAKYAAALVGSRRS